MVVPFVLFLTAMASYANAAQLFGPNLVVAVTNSTSEGVEILINGKNTGFLPAFESRRLTWRIFEPWIGNRPVRIQLSLTAKVCGRVAIVSTVPRWAADSERWGRQAAITDDYLEGSPTEDDVRRRVELLKKALDGGKVLGRKQMKDQLNDWFESVKSTGSWIRPVCETTTAVTDPYKTTVYVRPGGEREQVSAFVQENRGRYRLTGR